MPYKLQGKEYDSKNEEERKAYHKEYLRQWRLAHPDKVKAYVKKSNEKIKTDPECKAKHIEATKKWRAANADKLKEQARVRGKNKYQNDPEHREKVKAYLANRYRENEAHRERVRERARVQYAMKKSSACVDVDI
jgi:hypothetical protein